MRNPLYICKRQFKKGEIIKNVIINAIEPYGATIISYFYDKKCFGNIILTIENKNGRLLNFYLDRGYAFLDEDKTSAINIFPKNNDEGYSYYFNFVLYIVDKVRSSQ